MLVNDVVISEDVGLIFVKKLSMFVKLQGAEQIDAVNIRDDFEIFAFDPDDLDFAFFIGI